MIVNVGPVQQQERVVNQEPYHPRMTFQMHLMLPSNQMKQRLGKKKHKLCEEIAGKKYTQCWTSAKYGHFIAECWIDSSNADYVNWKKQTMKPKIRDGQLLRYPSSNLY